MDNKGIYELLERTFIDTFIDELLPRIFHNLANPLNGIMGRSKLMQRRLSNFVKKIEDRYPDIEAALGTDYRKLMSDIDSINNESERFFDMFRVSTEKFDAIGAYNPRALEAFNLSTLIEAELGFADFYLDFKHNIKKEIRLDREAPEISGVVSFYSMALWIFLRQAMMNRTEKNNNTFCIVTDHDDEWVVLRITYPGSGMFQGWQGVSFSRDAGADVSVAGMDAKKDLICALRLLQQGSSSIEITSDEEKDRLTIRIPYHQKERKDQKQR